MIVSLNVKYSRNMDKRKEENCVSSEIGLTYGKKVLKCFQRVEENSNRYLKFTEKNAAHDRAVAGIGGHAR